MSHLRKWNTVRTRVRVDFLVLIHEDLANCLPLLFWKINTENPM